MFQASLIHWIISGGIILTLEALDEIIGTLKGEQFKPLYSIENSLGNIHTLIDSRVGSEAILESLHSIENDLHAIRNKKS